jgi:tetratricopeptide (TPR) repeat protein
MEPRTLATALLNLSGLSAGYVFLRRWRRAGLHLVLTGGLIGLAFASDASRRPGLWMVVAAGWLAWMTVDGWRQARFDFLITPAPSRAPVVIGIALALLVPVGFGQYRAAGARTFEGALDAHRAGDCDGAIARYRKVSSIYELTLSANVAAADANIPECDVFLTSARAQAAGDYDQAIDGYHRYQHDYPGGLLLAAARRNVPEAYARWGAKLRDQGRYAEAVTRYRSFLEEYGDTDERPRIVDGLAEAHAGWGGQDRQRGEYEAAIGLYRDFLREFGESGAAPRIKNELAATHAEQAAALRDRAGGQAPADADVSFRAAVEQYALVLRDFGDTPTAMQVPQILLDTYDRAVQQLAPGGPCGVVPVLDAFLALAGDPVAPVVARAREAQPPALYDCGLEKQRNGDNAGAVEHLKRLATTYPASPLVAQSEPALIAARIGVIKGGSTSALPPPQAVGSGAPGGSVIVEVINDSPEALEILVNGQVAKMANVDACATCRDTYVRPLYCPTDPRPTTRLQLPAGHYDVVVQATSSPGVTPYSGV